MYFRAFQEEGTPNLSAEIILTVEYLTTQILTNADPQYLGEVLDQGMLIDVLYRELSSLGHLRKAILPTVKEYLSKHESSLTEVANLMRKEPDNRVLREKYLIRS
jgi:hypothetical protein